MQTNSLKKKYTDELDFIELLKSLAPLERTLANNATDKAFKIIQNILPDSKIEGYPTGKQVWTWKIPPRWEYEKATLSLNGKILVDVKEHPLYLLNYSDSFTGKVSLTELNKHLFTDQKNPTAIPFSFKFYEKDWGFSVPHQLKTSLKEGMYDVDIKTNFINGNFNVLTDFLKGEKEETIILCANICHPTQVNDSLSGIPVLIDIFKRLKKLPNRKYSYRLMIVPETIGSITYLSHHPEIIKNSVGGIFAEMLGNKEELVAQNSRNPNSFINFLFKEALQINGYKHKIVPFLKSAANDEKVIDSPGVDIPCISLTRYPYPEYHTNNDNINLMNLDRLREGRDILQTVIDLLEFDFVPKLKYPGPIFLSGYDLYPNWREKPELKAYWDSFIDIMYAFEENLSLCKMANKIDCPLEHVIYWIDRFHSKGLLSKKEFILQKKSLI